MAGTVALKFHDSTISFLTGYADDSPAPAITGITQANPPVVTDSGHGLEDGDVIQIDGVVGMTEVNGGTFVVDVLSSSTFSLRDVDATGYGAYVSGGTYQEGLFSNFCNLTNYDQQGGTSPEIATTALCSTAQEYLLGLPDFGTTSVDYFFTRDAALEQALNAAYVNGTIIAVRIDLPGDHGRMVQLGFVQQMSISAGVGAAVWTGSMTIRNTGARQDFDAAP